MLAGVLSATMLVPATPLWAAPQANFTTASITKEASTDSEVTINTCDPVYTVSGVNPILPSTVKVTTTSGEEEREVTWNLDEANFSKIGKVTLKGAVTGTTQEASIDVRVVMENAVYFIDCNAAESPELVNYADLVNTTADQKYGDGNLWGYVGEYLSHGEISSSDNYDMYETGWYIDKSKDITAPIEYRIPLKAGTYQAIFGFKEWWDEWNNEKSRSMKIFMQKGENGTEEELGTANAYDSDKNYWNKNIFEFSCEEDTDVILKVKPNEEGKEVVLSFLQIQKKLDLSAMKVALQNAAVEGHKLLYLSSATQETVDAATKTIV